MKRSICSNKILPSVLVEEEEEEDEAEEEEEEEEEDGKGAATWSMGLACKPVSRSFHHDCAL